jgi:hypothetical protein
VRTGYQKGWMLVEEEKKRKGKANPFFVMWLASGALR